MYTEKKNDRRSTKQGAYVSSHKRSWRLGISTSTDDVELIWKSFGCQSNLPNPDIRYKVIQKVKYANAKMVWHSRTQSEGTFATVFLVPSTVASRPLEPIIATKDELLTRP
ncbi:hypothetical protein CLF_104025 [Clonorchis sinensis]|uniref:Uncharacterized protein n=1 Tax=Clonorchis sinensis TaxID=79923 RepID=G7YNQ7_CLOSI|nr:hypothetical protein CLF_104025 [Clonorchis sinensis]